MTARPTRLSRQIDACFVVALNAMAGIILFANVDSFLEHVGTLTSSHKSIAHSARRFVGLGGFRLPRVFDPRLEIAGIGPVELRHAGRLELQLFEEIRLRGAAPLLLRLLELAVSNVLGIFYSDPQRTDKQLQTHAIAFRVAPDEGHWYMQDSHATAPRPLDEQSVRDLCDYCFASLFIFQAAVAAQAAEGRSVAGAASSGSECDSEAETSVWRPARSPRAQTAAAGQDGGVPEVAGLGAGEDDAQAARRQPAKKREDKAARKGGAAVSRDGGLICASRSGSSGQVELRPKAR